MIIFRYLAREIVITLAALTTILMLIFISNQFVHFFVRAAGGKMPAVIVFRMLTLMVPHLLGLLLPLGLYIALLLALGRFYVDSEMTVLSACGFSQGKLYSMVVGIAAVVMVIVAGLVLWLNPIISAEEDVLRTGGSPALILQALAPGRFQQFSSGRKVIYIKQMQDDPQVAKRIFVAEQDGIVLGLGKKWRLIVAKSGKVESNKKNGQSFVVLNDGYAYQGVPGSTHFRIIHFDKMKFRLPQPKPRLRHEERAMPTLKLLSMSDKSPRIVAEIQWRFAPPIMVMILALLAIPMSNVNPRQGLYAKLLPAVLLFIVYANFVFIGRDWITKGRIPAWIGLWWLHLLMLTIALVLAFAPQIKRRVFG